MKTTRQENQYIEKKVKSNVPYLLPVWCFRFLFCSWETDSLPVCCLCFLFCSWESDSDIFWSWFVSAYSIADTTEQSNFNNDFQTILKLASKFVMICMCTRLYSVKFRTYPIRIRSHFMSVKCTEYLKKFTMQTWEIAKVIYS